MQDVGSARPVTYELQVDNNVNFGSPEVEAPGLTGTTFTSTTELAPGIYAWRVRARDGAGNVSRLPQVWAFIIVAEEVGNWDVAINVSTDVGQPVVTLGVHSDATDGFDPGLDLLAPPAAPAPSVRTYLICPTCGAGKTQLIQNMVADAPGQTLEWLLFVEYTKENLGSYPVTSNITLSWPDLAANLPADREFKVLDFSTLEELADARAVPEFTFQVTIRPSESGTTVRFRVQVTGGQ